MNDHKTLKRRSRAGLKNGTFLKASAFERATHPGIGRLRSEFHVARSVRFLEQRKHALEQTRTAALARADQLDKRIKEMQKLVQSAVPSAGARVVEAESKIREAYQKSGSGENRRRHCGTERRSP